MQSSPNVELRRDGRFRRPIMEPVVGLHDVLAQFVQQRQGIEQLPTPRASVSFMCGRQALADRKIQIVVGHGERQAPRTLYDIRDDSLGIVQNPDRQAIPRRWSKYSGIVVENVDLSERPKMGNAMLCARHPFIEQKARPLLRILPASIDIVAMTIGRHDNP